MNSFPAQTLTHVANPDQMLLRLWLHGRSVHTAKAYSADARRMLDHVGKPAAQITLDDLQAWADSLADLSAATQARHVASIKSLFRFAKDTGYLGYNPAAALRSAKPQTTLAARIIAEEGVLRTIGAEQSPRLKAMLRLLYVCGLRRAEVAGLRWRDLVGNDRKGGQAQIHGKGGKVRHVGIPAALWRELAALSPSATPSSPVIPGRDGQPIHEKAVYRAVKSAARRGGIDLGASPHWFRHSHASHALDNGADLAGLRDGMGHASIATTGRYLHARPGAGPASFIKSGS